MVAAVAIGAGLQIPAVALLDGFGDEIRRQVLLREHGHILVQPDGAEPFENVAATVTKIAAIDGVEGVSVRLVHAGFVRDSGAWSPVRVVGFSAESEAASSRLCARVDKGRCPKRGEDRAILLGYRQHLRLGKRVGDRLRVLLPWDDLGDVALSNRPYTVVGILRGGGIWQADLDVYMPIDVLGDVVDRPDAANRFAVYLCAMDQTSRALSPVAATVPGAVVKPWWKAHAMAHNAIRGNARITALIGLLFAFAVLVPVLTVLLVQANNERSHMAVLLSLGLAPSTVAAASLFRAVMLTAIGVMFGVITGLFLCEMLAHWPIYRFDGFVVRPLVTAPRVVGPAAVLLVVGSVAGAIPALMVARTNIVAVLRGSGDVA